MNISECHPYYFQMLSHVLWEICQEAGVITQQRVEEAVNILISRESSAYIALWEGLTINQKNLMCALAWEEHPEVFSKKFLEKYSLGASSSIQKALKKLLRQDLVQQCNGSYIILDPFLKRWIRRIWK